MPGGQWVRGRKGPNRLGGDAEAACLRAHRSRPRAATLGRQPALAVPLRDEAWHRRLGRHFAGSNGTGSVIEADEGAATDVPAIATRFAPGYFHAQPDTTAVIHRDRQQKLLAVQVDNVQQSNTDRRQVACKGAELLAVAKSGYPDVSEERVALPSGDRPPPRPTHKAARRLCLATCAGPGVAASGSSSASLPPMPGK